MRQMAMGISRYRLGRKALAVLLAGYRSTATFLPLGNGETAVQAIDMKPRLIGALRSVQRALRTQLHLQQNFVDRYDLTGRETALAARALRWRGDELLGDQLPRW